MAQITIDLYQVGYVIGRYGIKVAKAVGKSSIVYHGGVLAGGTLFALESSKLATVGYKKLANYAILHKIDVNDPEVVTENVFQCLEFLE